MVEFTMQKIQFLLIVLNGFIFFHWNFEGHKNLIINQDSTRKMNLIEEIKWGEIKYRLNIYLDKNKPSELYKPFRFPNIHSSDLDHHLQKEEYYLNIDIQIVKER